MAGTDDLAPLMTPRPPQPPYGQGVLKAWDPDTFENIVQFRGDDLVNLPVKSSVEALTYRPGDTVILVQWPSSRGGSGSWWIDGRAVIPGTGRGEEAIAFMTTALGSAVARSVIGSSVFFDETIGQGERDVFNTFGDLEDALGDPTLGPERTFTLDGDKFIAVWGATFNADSRPGTDVQGYMSLDIDGPTSVAPTIFGARKFSSSNDGGAFTDESLAFGRVYDSMTSGEYTVTAKYRIDNGSNPQDLKWLTRWLLIIAF